MMRDTVLGTALCIGLAVTPALTATMPSTAAAADVKWDMQSTYPSSLPQLGALGKRVAEQIGTITGGTIEVKFQEPGAIVPSLETFDAVSSGAVQAAWSSPGFWTGKDVGFAMFASVPFGPAAPEYLAWMKFGGGEELMRKLYANYNIHSIPCTMIAPEAAGWFRKEINTVDDLKGLKMRFFGLGARVMEKLGVSTQLLGPGDIYPALERGAIDATEFSMPAIDLGLGFHNVAKYYYFPGWHQQSTFLDLAINIDAWNELTDTQKAQIESVCDAAIVYGLAEGETIQFEALQKLQAEGVEIKTWSPEILEAMEAGWNEVVAEEKQKSPAFAEAWDSLAAFRENYGVWRDIATLR
ncbi:TRAP transporter substrate-binding protein [Arenibaculum sp.]|uniref:TRAP transporter substrate-binding protein n=1 Tax=Arenibaculum sp. TaxID=2865862 RepID=UPI002E0F3C36|nr:TRAP transporter substrate-binding protein [Arenibaculum sp.]